jgi:hypothetical protein
MNRSQAVFNSSFITPRSSFFFASSSVENIQVVTKSGLPLMAHAF